MKALVGFLRSLTRIARLAALPDPELPARNLVLRHFQILVPTLESKFTEALNVGRLEEGVAPPGLVADEDREPWSARRGAR